jgi:hypothetical protein
MQRLSVTVGSTGSQWLPEPASPTPPSPTNTGLVSAQATPPVVPCASQVQLLGQSLALVQVISTSWQLFSALGVHEHPGFAAPASDAVTVPASSAGGLPPGVAAPPEPLLLPPLLPAHTHWSCASHVKPSPQSAAAIQGTR